MSFELTSLIGEALGNHLYRRRYERIGIFDRTPRLIDKCCLNGLPALTHLLYLTPSEAIINEKGLTPDIAVEQSDVEFGQQPPPTDSTLDKAIEQLKTK